MSDNEIELQQPHLSSQPSDYLCSDFFQQQQHVKDHEVTIDMKEMIQDCGDGVLVPECCIYRVPLMLRQVNEEAYTPKLVSVGPFHYGNERLKDMERHKQVMFKRFTHRARSSLDDLVRLVKHLEPKVRASYSETINLTEHQLVKLTLTDAGFIIQLFSMSMNEIGNDAKLSQPWLEGAIIDDLLLLENQLPFFVIEDLFNKAFPQNHDGRSDPSFLKLAYAYFGRYNTQKLKPNLAMKIKHFTDLLRVFHLHGKTPQRECLDARVGSHRLLYKANDLLVAGIKLRPTSYLLDLKFSGLTLEIPQILVEENTELLFRNMIALEQCHYHYNAHITDYAVVMDWLIGTRKDVHLLVDKEIVRHYLDDSHNIASIFNGLLQNVILSTFNSEYIHICKRLNAYCENPWHKLKTIVGRDYFSTPWDTVTFILSIFTIVQTILSVLQVVLQVVLK